MEDNHPSICREYKTTDHEVFTVRPAEAADCEAVLAMQRAAIEESVEFFVRTVSEFEAEADASLVRLRSLLSAGNSVLLVADTGDGLVGALDFHGGVYERVRHVGHFGLTVQRDYRERGVGNALLEVLMLWAYRHPVIEKACITLFTNNTRAINLCARYGFRAEGRRHREYRVAPGRYLDAVQLAKWLK